MKLTTLISFIFISAFSFGQTKKYTEKEIYQLFKKSISQNSKKSILTYSNPFVSCNNDSAYFQKNTIQIFNNLEYASNPNCCNYIGWTFYKKNRFILNDFDKCKASSKVTTAKDFYEIKVFYKKKMLFFENYRLDKTLISTFKVLNIENNLSLNSVKITLQRVN